MTSNRSIGLITVRKIGKRYILCVSGDPQRIYKTRKEACEKADRLRKKVGRRVYKKKGGKKR